MTASAEDLQSRIQAVIETVVRRRIAGEALPDDAVLIEFPGLGNLLADELTRLRIIEAAEIRADALPSESTDAAGYSATPRASGRLRVRCPNCREPFEMPSDSPIADFVCGNCGSHFCLTDSDEDARAVTAFQQLAHFELVERIGMGGFGTVWKGYDKQLQRTVAVKLPHQARMNNQELEKFLREARAAAQLRHTHIVSVHEVGRDGGMVFIVSDYIEGGSLDDWLARQQPTMRQSAELCLDLAGALHHAHEHGVIHRDLKPANILMDRDGRPHITDFGLARREAGEVTMTLDGQLLGTPAYMSPEQAQGEAHTADRRSDVYSLGVLLFQLLTGELPFRGNARMLVQQVIHDDPPTPHSLNASVAKDLETIALKCLEKKPEHRYPTAQAVADELQRFLNCEPILARPISRLERGWRWAKKNLYAATSLALVGLLLIGTTLVFAYLSYQHRETSRILFEENHKTLGALQEAKAANKKSFRVIADSLENQGHQLCENGSLAIGLHNLARALDYAERSEDKPLTELVRYDFNAWAEQLPRLKAVFPHPGTEIRAVASSPDGKWYATGGMDGTVKVWRAKGNHELEASWNLVSGVMALAWRPQSDQILAQCLDGTAQCMEVRTPEKPMRVFKYQPWGNTDWMPGAIESLPNGESALIMGTGGEIKRWTWSTGDQIGSAYKYGDYNSYCGGIAIAPDGKTILLSGNFGTVVLRDVETAKQIGNPVEMHQQNRCLAVLPDNAHFVAGYHLNETLQIWNIERGKPIGEPLQNSGKPLAVAVTTDGTRIACVGESPQLTVWEFANGDYANPLRSYRIYLGCHSQAVTFAPNGSAILTGGPEYACLWDLSRPHPIWKSAQLPAFVQCLDMHPSGRELAVGLWRQNGHEDEGNYIYRLDGQTGNQISLRLDATHYSSDWIDDIVYDHHVNRIYGVVGTRISCWDSETGKLLATYESPNETYYHLIQLSETGERLVGYGRSGPAEVWDTASHKLVAPPLKIDSKVITALTFNPAGNTLYGFSDGRSHLWRSEDGTPVGQIRELAYIDATSVLFHPSGKAIILGCKDRTVRQFPIDEGPSNTPIIRLDELPVHIACSRDGKLLFSNEWSNQTSLWHMPTGRKIGPELDGGKPLVCSHGEVYLIAPKNRYVELWPLPGKTTKEVSAVVRWTRKGTGLQLSDSGDVSRMDWREWQDLKE